MRPITTGDYFTDAAGEICLKPEIKLTAYWDFAETFTATANTYVEPDTGERWRCEMVHGENFLGQGSIPLVAIPMAGDWCYYAVTAGPVPVRKLNNVLRHDYAEIFVQVKKVRYENGQILPDAFPVMSAYGESYGSEDAYDPAVWSEKAFTVLKNIHLMYGKTLKLRHRMEAEGMI